VVITNELEAKEQLEAVIEAYGIDVKK